MARNIHLDLKNIYPSARSRPGTLTPITEEYLAHFTEFGLEERGGGEYFGTSDPGRANPAYTSTPRKSSGPGLALMESCSHSGDRTPEPPEPPPLPPLPPLPEMFSLGVQTMAPSCVATIRQSSDIVHQRQASLV